MNTQIRHFNNPKCHYNEVIVLVPLLSEYWQIYRRGGLCDAYIIKDH